MELVGSGLNRKKKYGDGRIKKNEVYFEDVEVIYLAMDEAELNRRLVRVMRALLEIDEILVSREIALLGQDHAKESEAA